MKLTLTALTILTCTLLAGSGNAGIGEDFSTATIATSGDLSLFCLPDGSGSALYDAYVKGGSGGSTVSADATITLSARTAGDLPIAGYPAEDLWLSWIDSSELAVCHGGTVADAATDAEGITTWTRPLRLGGRSESLMQVVMNGNAVTNSPGLALSVNSADINHDGIVDLADVGLFARDYADRTVPYRSDFACDNVMNVADVGRLALGLGAECP